MHVLHGTWLPGDFVKADGGLILWAETSESALARARRAPNRSPRAHPFALPAKTLRRAWLNLMPDFDGLLNTDAREATAIARLPSSPGRPQASPGLVLDEENDKPSKLQLAHWRIDALIVPPVDAPALLAALPSEDDTTPGIKIGVDLRF